MSVVRTDAPGVRLGVVVSNRFLPRAVDRNAFKRTVREVFRRRLGELPGCDVLIRLRASLKKESRATWVPSVAGSAVRLLQAIER